MLRIPNFISSKSNELRLQPKLSFTTKLLPSKFLEFLHINGLHPAVERKDDRQSHGHLGCGDCNDEQGENLKAEQVRGLGRLQKSRKGNKVETGSVQHKFNTHEDANSVPSSKHGVHAQTKKE